MIIDWKFLAKRRQLFDVILSLVERIRWFQYGLEYERRGREGPQEVPLKAYANQLPTVSVKASLLFVTISSVPLQHSTQLVIGCAFTSIRNRSAIDWTKV